MLPKPNDLFNEQMNRRSKAIWKMEYEAYQQADTKTAAKLRNPLCHTLEPLLKQTEPRVHRSSSPLLPTSN
jgi:hypothetical protein